MLNNLGFLDFGLASIFISILILAVFIFEVAMAISVVKNNVITSNTKILWIIGMCLVHPFVAIMYYFTDHKKTM